MRKRLDRTATLGAGRASHSRHTRASDPVTRTSASPDAVVAISAFYTAPLPVTSRRVRELYRAISDQRGSPCIFYQTPRLCRRALPVLTLRAALGEGGVDRTSILPWPFTPRSASRRSRLAAARAVRHRGAQARIRPPRFSLRGVRVPPLSACSLNRLELDTTRSLFSRGASRRSR